MQGGSDEARRAGDVDYERTCYTATETRSRLLGAYRIRTEPASHSISEVGLVKRCYRRVNVKIIYHGRGVLPSYEPWFESAMS